MAAAKGLQKPMNLSPELEAIVGSGPMSRPAAVKALWGYIKSNNLQDANDKTMINTDDKLKTIFDGESQVHMMKIAKYMSKHFVSAADSASDDMPMAA